MFKKYSSSILTLEEEEEEEKIFIFFFWRRRGSARNKKIFLYDHQRRWKWTFYFLSRDGRGKFCKVAKNIFFYSHHIRRRIENIFFFSSEGWGVSLNFQKYSSTLTKEAEKESIFFFFSKWRVSISFKNIFLFSPKKR